MTGASDEWSGPKVFPVRREYRSEHPSSIRKQPTTPIFSLDPWSFQFRTNITLGLQTPRLNFKAKSLLTFAQIYLTNLKTFCCSSPQQERAGRHLVWTRTYDRRWTNLLHIPPCDQLIDENTPVFHINHITESYRTFSCSSFARKNTWN